MMRLLHFLMLVSAVSAASGAQAPVCRPLFHDQILARDLGAAVPPLALLPPDLKLGYSPVPGAQRVFRVSQLQRLATQFGIAAKIAAPVCFAWTLHSLSTDEIAAAIHKSLPGQQADLNVIDHSRFPVPEGDISFPLQGLSGNSDKPAVWNGFVQYGDGRRFEIWARVLVTVHEKHVIAVRSIEAGESIDSAALKSVDYTGPLRRSPALRDAGEAVGQCARWTIASGTVLAKNMLVPPLDVEREQLVVVHVNNGAAHIETQGVADDGGYKGNVIRVHNPQTGRVFRARIDDHGVVTVVPGGKIGLVVEDKKS